MAVEDDVLNIIRFLQILGGIFGIYLVFWGISAYLNIKRMRILKKMLVQLEHNNERLEKLIRKSKK